MTTTTGDTVAPEILPYLKELKRRLAGLPEEERLELLADLETHLEEIVSEEADGSLAERIGTPVAYADEFAASIGVDDVPEPSLSALEAFSVALRDLGDHPAFERARRLGYEMRPAWWAIRGLAIGLAVMWSWFRFGDPYGTFVVRLLAAVVVIVAIWASMRIGRNRLRSPAWKWASVAVTVVGIFAGWLMLATASNELSYYHSVRYGGFDPYIEYGGEYGEYGPSAEDLDRMIAEGVIAPMTTTTFPPPDAPLIVTP